MTDALQGSSEQSVRSLIPARIDRLPWSPFHTRMVLALGTAWVLDGLEITIASNVGDQLSEPGRLGLTATQVSLLATIYLLGEVVGALFFGRISDKLGRRNLFMVTLAIYFLGSALTAFTFSAGIGGLIFLYGTRFVAGLGIGGEYAAINSAIDELIPAPYRGRTDIAINGSYWAGAAIAAALQYPLLSGALPMSIDWRVAFLIGPVLAIVIVVLRRGLPESPRWQLMHGRGEDAERSIAFIEGEVEQKGYTLSEVDDDRAIEVRPAPDAGYLMLLRVLFRTYPGRSTLGAVLMITQSFLYNAIFFTYATVLSVFFDVENTALYYIPFAVGNFIGPLVLGPLFDTVGRRRMISGTYVFSGALLVVSAVLFDAGLLSALTQTIFWCVIFFFASAGASSAYLTVSEIFPMEVRAKAIAVFFAIAQGVGSLAPLFYGLLVDENDPNPGSLFIGYLVGAAIMIGGGVTAFFLAVDAERQSLEDVATPLSVVRATGATGS